MSGADFSLRGALAPLLLFLPLALSGASLSNGTITAEFDERGLTAIDTYHFTRDRFSITISGRSYEPDAAVRTEGKQSITYAYSAGPYKIDVIYELRPGWGFLSKQLVIRSGPAGKFRLDRIEPFHASLAEPISDVYVLNRARPDLGTNHYGGFLHFPESRGLLVTAQNPFLTFERTGGDLLLSYRPDMEWDLAWGPFASDRGLLAPYRLTGRRQPEHMLAEWKLGPNDSQPGLDEAEVETFTALVRAFLLYKPERPLNLMVGWCVNDYQIDIGTPAGRTEYKRVLDRAAELGAEHVLFAPANSEVSRRDESRDDWGWEYVLWLGMGPKIRQNQWDPATGAIPSSVQEMLDYARSRKLGLMAYVYPVMGFTQNPEWLTAKGTRANLGVHALQEWLIAELEGFARHTGISGYSFDHTFLNLDGASRYAQWWGWRRVMETLRRDMPDIVIDGRQAYQNYGPWTWLAGSYPHPTSTDEQPESFVSFPDLSLDRVSADRERYTAYRYRNYEFAPSEIVPGFITHQTARNDDFGRMPEAGHVLLPFRRRDWDYLGWRYSLLSSIAAAGWNNVINMIPARDESEFAAFSEADRQWFRHWIDWTRQNREYLRHARPILGQPAIGKVDGTAAMIGDRGYVFLFNPNARHLTVDLAGTGLRAPFREIYPVEGRLHDGTLEMEGHAAMVLEVGSPSGGRRLTRKPFNPEITRFDPNFTGGAVTAGFTIPQRVFDQLEARRKAWPIPWTTEDYRSTWLAPQRLLLCVQLAEPDDQWSVSLRIDGRTVDLQKAYASVRANKRNFTGFYADISLLSADREHKLELQLPRGLKPGQFQGVFLENVEPE